MVTACPAPFWSENASPEQVLAAAVTPPELDELLLAVLLLLAVVELLLAVVELLLAVVLLLLAVVVELLLLAVVELLLAVVELLLAVVELLAVEVELELLAVVPPIPVAVLLDVAMAPPRPLELDAALLPLKLVPPTPPESPTVPPVTNGHPTARHERRRSPSETGRRMPQ